MNSFGAPVKAKFSAGKSGSVVFFSGDQSCLKALTTKERCVLLSIVPAYIVLTIHLRFYPSFAECHQILWGSIIRCCYEKHNFSGDLEDFTGESNLRLRGLGSAEMAVKHALAQVQRGFFVQ